MRAGTIAALVGMCTVVRRDDRTDRHTELTTAEVAERGPEGTGGSKGYSSCVHASGTRTVEKESGGIKEDQGRSRHNMG